MELNTHQSSKKKHVNFDDFDIEDIPFKPITDGLGFNDKKVSAKPSKKKIHTKMYDSIIPVENEERTDKKVPFELGAFYEAPVQEDKPRVQRDLSFEKKFFQDAPMVKRVVASVLDLFVVSFIYVVVFAMMFATTQMDMAEFALFLNDGLNLIFPIMLFTLIYLIFNISIGFQATPGQRALSLDNDFSELKGDIFYFLLKRSLLELISIPLVGIPYMLNLDSKLLGNKVIQK